MTEEPDRSPTIRTPDQRLRVFVSSTLAELADERAAVTRAIEALRLSPVLFEMGARPHPPRELYRAYLAQSDVFIGLYWQRYGWIGPDMDISGLEDEFRLSGALPRLIYVKSPAPEREDRLMAMIEVLQNEGTESYRSFATPDELDQLVRDDLALLLSERFVATPGPEAESPRLSRSLPVPSTSLIGRDDDIASVTNLFVDQAVRLVTVTGAGGIGKTRLAVAVAEALSSNFPDRTVFVSLGAVTDPELVMPRVADAVGASMAGVRPSIDVIAEHIADTPTLLVLDNLEQVVTVAADLDQLLTRCPKLQILATSRTPLRIRAEHEYPIGALDVPPASAHMSPDALSECSCIELFVDRARAVRYDFVLTPENAHAIAEICRRLDGLPLAIELAAARVRLLGPADLLARLEDSLDALGTGPVDLPERQRTLRATVEWSIDLLREPECDMLATLSVFVDGWTLAAATRVADVPDDIALDLLDALAGHSLMKVDATATGLRFRLLESVRELVAERFAAHYDRAEAERRHANFYRDLVASMDWPGESHADWAEQLRIEEENIRRAIRWFLANDIRPLPHMFRALWLFWQMQDRMPDGRQWIDEMLQRIDSFDAQSALELLLTSAMTAVEVGDDVGALAAAEAIDRLEEPIEDPFLRNSAQLALAWIRPIDNDDEGALRAALAAYDGYLEHDEPVGAAGAAMSAGMLSFNLGRPDDARHYFAEVDRLAGQSGNNWLEQGAKTQVAMLAVANGDLDEARRLVAAALDLADPKELSTYTLAFALVSFAHVLLAEGRARPAAMALGAATGLRTRAGVRTWPAARRNEDDVLARVEDELGEGEFAAAFATGTRLQRNDAIALVRGAS